MRYAPRPTVAEQRWRLKKAEAQQVNERDRYATLRDARVNVHAAICRYFDIGALRPFTLPIVTRRVG